MKLIDITCPKCSAQMQVNPNLKKCTCNYCGNEMLIDDEIVHHQIDNGYDFGYQAEKGRIQAQKDAIAKEQARQAQQKSQATMGCSFIFVLLILTIVLFSCSMSAGKKSRAKNAAKEASETATVLENPKEFFDMAYDNKNAYVDKWYTFEGIVDSINDKHNEFYIVFSEKAIYDYRIEVELIDSHDEVQVGSFVKVLGRLDNAYSTSYYFEDADVQLIDSYTPPAAEKGEEYSNPILVKSPAKFFNENEVYKNDDNYEGKWFVFEGPISETNQNSNKLEMEFNGYDVSIEYEGVIETLHEGDYIKVRGRLDRAYNTGCYLENCEVEKIDAPEVVEEEIVEDEEEPTDAPVEDTTTEKEESDAERMGREAAEKLNKLFAD